VDGLARHYVNRAKFHGLANGYSACSREQLESALPVLTELLRRNG
jgi:GntR family transcriptional regulator/MocR family aminotransferase